MILVRFCGEDSQDTVEEKVIFFSFKIYSLAIFFVMPIRMGGTGRQAEWLGWDYYQGRNEAKEMINVCLPPTPSAAA